METTVISIVGPRKSGKTTFINSLANSIQSEQRLMVKQYMSLITKNGRKFLFIESTSDTLDLLNLSKISDIVVFMVDGYFGLELETFEFINFIRNDKKKRIFFIITHLDLFKNWKSLKKTKKKLKDRLDKETQNGKIFFISGVNIQGFYYPKEIENVNRFLFIEEIEKFSDFKDSYYFLITEIMHVKKFAKHSLILKGFSKNRIDCNFKNTTCHISGLGDIVVKKIFNQNSDINFNRKRKKLKKKFKKIFNNKKNFFFFYYLKFFLENQYKGFASSRYFYKIDSCQFSLKNIISHNQSNYLKVFDNEIPKNHFSNERETLSEKNSNKISKKLSEIEPNKFSFPKFKRRTSDEIEYVKIEIKDLPIYFKKNFYPASLYILSINEAYEKKNFFLVSRILRHKWCNQSVLSGDFCLISIGWRLIYTKVYIIRQITKNNFKLIKFLPYYRPAHAFFYSNVTKKNDNVIGLFLQKKHNKVSNQGSRFSISFTGKIEDRLTSLNLFHKIKIQGKICKIFQKTAFINGMFHTEFEAIKYIGSIIKTQDGTRGVIKGLSRDLKQGTVRATFEKKIQTNQKVFFSIWCSIKPSKLIFENLFLLMPVDVRELRYKTVTDYYE